METTANDDWKADMLAAWEAGELEMNTADGDDPPRWFAWKAPLFGTPVFDCGREFYRRRPSAEKPQEPADPNAAMIARDGEGPPKLPWSGCRQVTLPKGVFSLPADLRDGAPTSPKYAEYAEPTASVPSAPAGLTACAPFTHKLGGWGL